MYKNIEQFDKAIPYCLKALSINPNNDVILLTLGQIYGAKRDLYKAKKYFEQAVAANPNNAEAWGGLGGIYYLMGMKDEAINALKRACELGLEDACSLISRL